MRKKQNNNQKNGANISRKLKSDPVQSAVEALDEGVLQPMERSLRQSQ
jgi:hypothetical protein